jgi:hypothetical protein
MALSKIDTAGLVADAVDNTILDLTSNFAFTGTVTGAGGYTQGTKVSPTSGTTVDFTGIPNDVKVIHVLFNELDMSAAGWSVVQLGDSGGFETTGYTSAVGYPGSGNSYYANPAADDNGCKFWYQGTTKHSGFVTIMRMSTDQTQWVMWSRCHAAEGGSYSTYSAVEKTLSAALTQIRITHASASFVAGDINILYTS